MQLFHESLNDALREVIAACGGPKQIAAKVWPEKAPDAAHRLLLDCLNETRPERLSPDRLRLILRAGREANCHAGMNWLLQDLGYADCKPLSPQDEQDELMRDYIKATKVLSGIASRIESRVPGVRRAA